MDPAKFDVDSRTGFLPSEVPVQRLPGNWSIWEVLLDEAIAKRLALGGKPGGTTVEQAVESERWRASVRETPLLDTSSLEEDLPVSRRAHLVLAFLLSFYVQTLPPTSKVVIPKSVGIPILRLKALGLPPVVTYADCVLYNWHLAGEDANFASENLRCRTLFTSLPDEEVFYLASTKVEFRGAEALESMRAIEERAGEEDLGGIIKHLKRLAVVIDELKEVLMNVREGCDPDVFYNEIRPWSRGQSEERPWVFEAIEDHSDLMTEGVMEELSGTSAAQSSLIQALDVFLGVEGSGFKERMKRYMPRNHRDFLDSMWSIRSYVLENSELVEAYNAVLLALKGFRDSHMIIVTLYIVGPARRAETEKREAKGMAGGGDFVKLLKGARDQTAEMIIPM
ncbi:hypothetical protein V5O48_013506 [Marasmius crinis-equi]|uniref:Indoleamine 2,3-dioxygenase n=1 Tax=Marasmius crinis-equi TaxID=585013 RepID=A0ABR3F096_9AGAR